MKIIKIDEIQKVDFEEIDLLKYKPPSKYLP